MTNLLTAWALAAFVPCLVVTGLIVVVESRYRTTEWPTRAEWAAAGRATLRHVRSSLEEDGPRSRGEWLGELAWIAFGPALAVRALLHVAAATLIAGGDPGELDFRASARSVAVDVDRLTDLRLRFAVACYGGFWAMYGTQSMDPIGRIYFAVQLALLLIDPGLWLWHWVLAPTFGDIMTRTHETETEVA